jgi:hypothetical protein
MGSFCLVVKFHQMGLIAWRLPILISELLSCTFYSLALSTCLEASKQVLELWIYKKNQFSVNI